MSWRRAKARYDGHGQPRRYASLNCRTRPPKPYGLRGYLCNVPFFNMKSIFLAHISLSRAPTIYKLDRGYVNTFWSISSQRPNNAWVPGCRVMSTCSSGFRLDKVRVLLQSREPLHALAGWHATPFYLVSLLFYPGEIKLETKDKIEQPKEPFAPLPSPALPHGARFGDGRRREASQRRAARPQLCAGARRVTTSPADLPRFDPQDERHAGDAVYCFDCEALGLKPKRGCAAIRRCDARLGVTSCTGREAR